MVAIAFFRVVAVDMANIADVAPAPMTIVVGTEASCGSELDNAIVAPPFGAGAVSETVAVTAVPPTTVDLFSVNVASDGDVAAGVTVNVVVFVMPA